MNKTILLAMKWLKDPESVSREELNEAEGLACEAFDAAPYGNHEAEYYALGAIQRALHDDHLSVGCFVDEYFKLTGESREDYEKELNMEEWTIYNNEKVWKDLSDEQKGALLLAQHEGMDITSNGKKAITDFSFNSNVYQAIKPAPELWEVFEKDWGECVAGGDSVGKQMIAKGWKKK